MKLITIPEGSIQTLIRLADDFEKSRSNISDFTTQMKAVELIKQVGAIKELAEIAKSK